MPEFIVSEVHETSDLVSDINVHDQLTHLHNHNDEYLDNDDSDSNSDVSDYDTLGDSIKKEIIDGTYTCLVCTSEVDSDSHVWNCKKCYRVYHLKCIKQWALKSLASSNTGSNKNTNIDSWRCPSCNIDTVEVPSQYRCWCGKVLHPSGNVFSPHSCGQTCNHPLDDCVHGCSLQCHPGPHAQCTALGPVLSCKCGASKQQWPCIITPYKGWQCDKLCNELMPCGKHLCGKQCLVFAF